ncbi:MAG: 4-hydroxy-3-methylbut-2-enyl diphosphate reductase [Muribaculaceae bacterium]|nr:4-hydroxy-3-methylbut-2-enyl diphosphate reductase [Muribaculaceae bacterium]
MPKEIRLAKFAGFCYGVKRAVETAKKLKAENPQRNICVLGELIHNSQVIEELDSLGIKTLKDLPQQGDGICIVRSHGESPEMFEKIRHAGFEIYDLTCPDVKKVQQKAVELAKNGYYTIIVGKAEHPEVIAIKANAILHSDKVLVADNPIQLEPYEKDLKEHKKIGVVVQTTQMISTLNEIIKYLTPLSKELLVSNTICQSTAMRQAEAKKLAQNSDLMIVVGSKKSANTTHLAEILKDITKTIHIETDKELDTFKDLIESSERISVTAGASTPQCVIENVINRLNHTK